MGYGVFTCPNKKSLCGGLNHLESLRHKLSDILILMLEQA